MPDKVFEKVVKKCDIKNDTKKHLTKYIGFNIILTENRSSAND